MHPANNDTTRLNRMLLELRKRAALKQIDWRTLQDGLQRAWCDGITDPQWIAAAECALMERMRSQTS